MSEASSILFLASRAASSRILRASSAIFFAASRALCASFTADWALSCAVLACWTSRVAARTFASSGLSASDLLPVGSSLYLSASFDARVTHESAEDSFDCADVRSSRASRALMSALSASVCARSSFGQKSASASPHIPYDFSSFFKFLGTPSNSSLKTVADFPAHSARVDSLPCPSPDATPPRRRRRSRATSSRASAPAADHRVSGLSPGPGHASHSACDPPSPIPPSAHTSYQQHPYAYVNLQGAVARRKTAPTRGVIVWRTGIQRLRTAFQASVTA